MAIRQILQLGDPRLRQMSLRITHAEESHRTLDDLRDTLQEFRRQNGFGRGIAAIQIGIPQRVIYIEIDNKAYELVNPEFQFKSQATFELWDDCFSFPHLMVLLARSTDVDLIYEDRDGKNRELSATASFSELLQHEIDHITGILCIDRAVHPLHSFCTRDYYLNELLMKAPRTP